MIQANELRIGNYVLFNDNTDRLGIVESIHLIGIIGLSCNYTADHSENKTTSVKLDNENINPIPLTPEILEKCGFECFGDTYMGGLIYFRNNIKFVFNDDLMSFLFIGDLNVHELKYLHQLQNLYFALTGEELNIQL